MTYRDVPGSKRHPKGIQKTSKRCPKGVQIRSHWNKNSKIPMQRTAENHAPFQSFSSEQKSQHMQSRRQLASGLLTFVSVLLSDMQAFSMSRCTGTVHKKQLNNPNAKTCKEPCTPSELTKRRVTPRCGGVASAFSINCLCYGGGKLIV